MSTCPHCGHVNPEGLTLCEECNLPLLPASLPETDDAKRDTGVLDAVTPSAGTVRWGTASLGAERKLLLQVRGYDEPLIAPLTEMLILGRFDPDTGRAPDIDLDKYAAKDMGVSRRHAAIFLQDEGVKVVDLGSANSTFINGQRLVPQQTRILRDGDELRLGRLIIRVNFA